MSLPQALTSPCAPYVNLTRVTCLCCIATTTADTTWRRHHLQLVGLIEFGGDHDRKLVQAGHAAAMIEATPDKSLVERVADMFLYTTEPGYDGGNRIWRRCVTLLRHIASRLILCHHRIRVRWYRENISATSLPNSLSGVASIICCSVTCCTSFSGS